MAGTRTARNVRLPLKGRGGPRSAAPARAAEDMVTIQVPAGLQRRVLDAVNSMQVSRQIADLLAGSETPLSARTLASLGAREDAIRRIGVGYGLLTSADVARLAGSRSKNPSEYASSKARDWTAIALRRAGALAFPAFQFDPRTGKTYPALLPVFAAFRDAGWDQESVALWFVGPSGRLHGREPAGLISFDMETVLEAALDAAAAW